MVHWADEAPPNRVINLWKLILLLIPGKKDSLTRRRKKEEGGAAREMKRDKKKRAGFPLADIYFRTSLRHCESKKKKG